MQKTFRCPNEGCSGTWTFEGRVVRGYPRTRLEPREPSRFQVEGAPYSEDEHSCGGELTEEQEANLIWEAEIDPPEPEDDYDPVQEEIWWER